MISGNRLDLNANYTSQVFFFLTLVLMMELANKVLSFLSWVTTFVSYLETHLGGGLGSSASAVGALPGPGARGEKNMRTKTLGHTMGIYSMYANLFLCIDNPAQDRRGRPVRPDVLLPGRPTVIIDCVPLSPPPELR